MAGNKVSICLLNTKTGFTTPWHCSVAQLADGEWISAPMGEFIKDDRLELMYMDGQPSYFKEKPREPDALGISEATASYLQEARPLSASGYLTGASTPMKTSPGRLSLTPPATEKSSAATTPKTPSPRPLSSCSRDAAAEDELSSDLLLEGNNEAASIPYGKRLIPQIMDSLAVAEPDRTVFSLTTLSGGSPEFKQISALKFTKAVDKTAWWLHNRVGKPGSVLPIGYIGPRKLSQIFPDASLALQP